MAVKILRGDCRYVLQSLEADSVDCVVTSPPYWGLRDYGVAGQIGLEADYRGYIAAMLTVFQQVKRVLRGDGTLWLNLGDCYNAYNGGAGPSSALSRGAQTTARPRLETGYGLREKAFKPKDLCGIPWRVAFALQEDGWYLRQDIIWAKPNPMPESVTDRCTKAHEYLFLLSKNERYYYDADAIREPGSVNSHGGTPNQGGPKQEAIGQNHGGRLGVPAIDKRHGRSSEEFRGRAMRNSDQETFGLTRGKTNESCTHPNGRNRRSVWEIATSPFPEAHFATFPPALIEPCIKAGCPEGGTVLDPFGGAGTTGLVADRLRRECILIELNPEYAAIAERRLNADGGMFSKVSISG